jgi:toxin HigB-1
MIKTFAHKGLSCLHAADDHRGVRADHAGKLRRILTPLDASSSLADLDLPGYRLHVLRGNLAGFMR